MEISLLIARVQKHLTVVSAKSGMSAKDFRDIALADTGFGLFQGVFEGGLARVVSGGGSPCVALEVGSCLLRRNCQRLVAILAWGCTDAARCRAPGR